MDLLNRALAQLRDTYRAMSPRARLTSSLMLAVLAVAVGYLLTVQSRDSQIYLLGGHTFTNGEITAVQGAFGKAGLSDFEIEGGQIRVPRRKLGAYLAAMADAEVLPADFSDYWMQTIQEQSPWTSSRLHDQAMLAAHQRVLSNSISQMPGIDIAQVFISVLEKANFHGERLITASVDVKTIGDRPLDSRQVRAIRSLVAGGTAGLKRQQITVVDSAGHDFPGYEGTDEFGDAYFVRQEAFEQRYEEAILRILSHVPGVAVSVHVELSPRVETVEAKADSESKDDSEAAAVTTAPSDARLDTAQAPHAANAQASLSDAAPKSDDPSQLRSTGSSNKPVGKVNIQNLFPQRVTASITVPSNYFEDLWRRNHLKPGERRAPEATALATLREEVSQKIQRHVLTVIPHDPAADPRQLVSVTSFDPIVATSADVAPVAGREAPLRSPRNWRTVGLCAGAVVGLALLWWVLPSTAGRKSSTDDRAREHRVASLEPSPLRSLSRRAPAAGGALREDLAEVVRENPDAAANVLRAWIGNAN